MCALLPVLLIMSVRFGLSLLALCCLAAASDPRCEELIKTQQNSTQVHLVALPGYRITILWVIIGAGHHFGKCSKTVYLFIYLFYPLNCIFVCRFLENGYSMLVFQSPRTYMRSSTPSTAPGLKSQLWATVTRWFSAGQIESNN